MSLDGGTVVIDVQARFRNNMSPGIDNADKKVDAFSASIEKTQKELDRMSHTNAKLDVKDTGTSKVEKFLRTTKQFAGKTFTSTVRIIDYATKPLQAIKNSLFSIKGLVAAVGSGMAFNAGILNPIAIADRDKNSEVFFNTLLGEGNGAAFVKKIEDIAKSSTMDYDASMGAVQSMLGMGWNKDTVLTDLQTLIDTTAALGGGADRLSGIALALSQIKSKGRLSTEELNQLAERGVNAKGILAEQLGYGSGDAGLMALSKDLQKGVIGSETAIAALMEGLKKSYDGLDEELARSSASGIMAQIKDTFKIDVVKRWGKGLQDGAVRSLGAVLDLVEENDELIRKLGDSFYNLGHTLSGKFADGVEKVSKRLITVLKSPEFENASLSGKFKIVWDEVIATPFSEWWDSTGKAFVVEKAGEIGKGLGSGISSGVAALLGFDAVGTTGDGLEIGKAFTDGFIEGLDTEKIKQAFLDTFKEIATDALKVLPGGDNPTTSSWISAGILGYLGRKPLGKMLGKIGDSLLKGVGGDDLAYMTWLYKNANPNGKGNFWKNLTGGASTLMGKVSGSKTAGFFKNNWLSLLFAGGAIASADNKWYEAGRQGSGLLGSAGGGWSGAKIGGAIGANFGPTGALIGAGIGGFAGSMAGYLGGDKLFGSINWSAIGDGLQNAANGLAEDAKKLAQLPNEIATGFSEFWSGVSESFNTFIYDTVPGWWDGVCSSIDTWWETNIGEPFSGVCASFQSAIDGIAGWFGEKKESFNTWWEGTSIKKGWDLLTGKEEKHATGGIFTRPHRGLVAEDGPEAIIPLGGSRRQTGLNLWRQAGMALGATAGGGGVNVGGVTVNITVDGGSGTLVDALNSQSEEIKEAIAGVLYAALSESFQNQPILI
ncbi:MAG: tape measure protein [Peptococcaceae bacterium]|nr:tape measure protein [Peptococcaceae bacterium]